jgi:hypothetical protein
MSKRREPIHTTPACRKERTLRCRCVEVGEGVRIDADAEANGDADAEVGAEEDGTSDGNGDGARDVVADGGGMTDDISEANSSM